MRRLTILAVLAGALAAPAVAGAHVTIQPAQVPADSYTVLTARVPNERDDSATVKVQLQLPPGVTSVSYEPEPGWRTEVEFTKLDTPIETPDGPITEAVSTLTWTGSGRGDGRIGRHQFRDFRFSMPVPGKPGDTLTFKALQTYDDGEVVRWIGGPESPEPAATVQVVEGAGFDAHGAATGAGAGAVAAAQAAEDDGSDVLAIVALAFAVLAFLAAFALLATMRRRMPR
ncbi:MAG: YcnI family protein [Solirubrobacteraceae bacterium]|nr:YcnI family protein [Solirubrobacteraceae bacterium]